MINIHSHIDLLLSAVWIQSFRFIYLDSVGLGASTGWWPPLDLATSHVHLGCVVARARRDRPAHGETDAEGQAWRASDARGGDQRGVFGAIPSAQAVKAAQATPPRAPTPSFHAYAAPCGVARAYFEAQARVLGHNELMSRWGRPRAGGPREDRVEATDDNAHT